MCVFTCISVCVCARVCIDLCVRVYDDFSLIDLRIFFFKNEEYSVDRRTDI